MGMVYESTRKSAISEFRIPMDLIYTQTITDKSILEVGECRYTLSCNTFVNQCIESISKYSFIKQKITINSFKVKTYSTNLTNVTSIIGGFSSGLFNYNIGNTSTNSTYTFNIATNVYPAIGLFNVTKYTKSSATFLKTMYPWNSDSAFSIVYGDLFYFTPGNYLDYITLDTIDVELYIYAF